MHEPVRTKRQFVDLYERGIFGNHTRTWATVKEFFTVGPGMESPGKLYHLRNRIAGGPTYYNLLSTEIYHKHIELVSQGCQASQFYVSEMSPDCTIFQGEISHGIWLYDLTYSLINAPMRIALAQQTLYAQGLKAKLLMEHYLDPGDWDWVQSLMENYENHVIEFSVFAESCGTLNRRMIVWETRLY